MLITDPRSAVLMDCLVFDRSPRGVIARENSRLGRCRLRPSARSAQALCAIRSGLLRDPLWAPGDGTGGLQASVSLVRGARHGPSGVGRLYRRQEPGAAAGRHCQSRAGSITRGVNHAPVHRFLSAEHFSVDGALIEAWASLKSLRSKDGGAGEGDGGGGRTAGRDCHGE